MALRDLQELEGLLEKGEQMEILVRLGSLVRLALKDLEVIREGEGRLDTKVRKSQLKSHSIVHRRHAMHLSAYDQDVTKYLSMQRSMILIHIIVPIVTIATQMGINLSLTGHENTEISL